MKRTDLLVKLERVAPALAQNDLIPVMCNFWFTGTEVMTYNDQIGISTPFKTDFKGAVPGALLLNLLKASKAENIDLSVDKDNLLVKVPKSKSMFRLAMMDADAFCFIMPKPKTSDAFTLDKERKFLSGIDACLHSVNNDTSVPDHLGVTIIPSDDAITLYSTDDVSMSRVYLKLKNSHTLRSRVILPTLFCTQMLSMTKDKDGSASLELYDDHVLLTVTNAVMFGRLIEVQQPLDFPANFKAHLPKEAREQLVPMPTKLRLILDRAAIVAEAERVTTSVTVRDGEMRFETKASHGEVVDTMQVDQAHPDADATLDAKLLKIGYAQFGSDGDILITDKCAIMTQGNAYFLVACRS